jgi:tRNA threonylcarbamoyladenosine biosynthesis protein TsaE
LYHFDFYRLTGGAPEFQEAGFREYFNPQSVCVVEWPDKAAGLPPADLKIELAVDAVGSGRNVAIFAESEAGVTCLRKLQSLVVP